MIRLKKISSLLFIFIYLHHTISFAQLNINTLTLNNAGAGYYSPSCINLANSGGPIEITLGTSNNPVSFTSATCVDMLPGFHVVAPTSSSAVYTAMLINQQLNATILEPANPSSVGLFNKVELGISLPSYIKDKINAYLSSPVKPGTSAYTTVFNHGDGTKINPYDPDHISIDALFFAPSSPNANAVVKNGFYYKNYSRVANGSGTLVNWQNAANNYEWRVRFAPTEVGVWNGTINVYLDQNKLQPISFAFSFTVVNTGNPGYLKVNPANNRYLQFSGPLQQTFFPIGDNHAWEVGVNPCNNLLGCTTPNEEKIAPDISVRYSNYRQKLVQAGGNFTRLILAGWSFEIERERLGNYDSRQIEMWELDDLIKNNEQSNVYMIFSLMVHDEFFSETWAPDFWSTNPYNANADINDPYKTLKGITGVTQNNDFFVNADAKAWYKKRLKYIYSRWGYSTSVAMYEMLTEVDQYQPNFWTDAAVRNNIYDWINEMSLYIKSLGDKHLVSASHTSLGGGTLTNTLWSKPGIDVISNHSYLVREFANRTRINDMRTVWNAGIDKPFINNEHDISMATELGRCTNIPFHNNIWASALSGSLSEGTGWEWHKYDENWEATGAEYQSNYKSLKNFVSLINLNKRYNPNYSVRNSDGSFSKFETIYLTQSDDYSKVYGWFHNRSYIYRNTNINCYIPLACNYNNTTTNYSTISSFLSQCQDASAVWVNSHYALFNDDGYQQVFLPQADYTLYPQTGGQMALDGFFPNSCYSVKWYSTWGGASGGTEQASWSSLVSTNSIGKLIVTTVPPTGNAYPGDWAFVLTKQSCLTKSTTSVNDLTDTNVITIQPNSNNGTFHLEVALESNAPYDVYIYDVLGKIVFHSKNNITSGSDIHLSKQPSGMYTVRIVSSIGTFTKKMIVEN
jgi:hypothetical protein